MAADLEASAAEIAALRSELEAEGARMRGERELHAERLARLAGVEERERAVREREGAVESREARVRDVEEREKAVEMRERSVRDAVSASSWSPSTVKPFITRVPFLCPFSHASRHVRLVLRGSPSRHCPLGATTSPRASAPSTLRLCLTVNRHPRRREDRARPWTLESGLLRRKRRRRGSPRQSGRCARGKRSSAQR